MIEHNFEKHPELTNNQMDTLYFKSPHKQITEDFRARVTKVHDGDTVSLKWSERDFEFPMRLADIDAPELNTGTPGQESRSFLERQVLEKDVTIRIDPKNRTEKWGRLLGKIIESGMDVGQMSVNLGFALPFERRKEGELPILNKELSIKKWL